MGADELHRRVERGVHDRDIDGLVALYEPDAVMFREGGTLATGLDEIREVWAGVVEFGGEMSLDTHYAVETGDMALLCNTWSFRIGGAVVATGTTAETARRQSDGSWLYVIDNPYGSAVGAAE
jgi:ketosteroid isomerase-like protein